MNLKLIRKYVSARPFKPLVFHLENSDKQIVKHSEIIITEIVISARDDEGLPVIIAPEAVSAIHYAKDNARRARSRKKSRAEKITAHFEMLLSCFASHTSDCHSGRTFLVLAIPFKTRVGLKR